MVVNCRARTYRIERSGILFACFEHPPGSSKHLKRVPVKRYCGERCLLEELSSSEGHIRLHHLARTGRIPESEILLPNDGIAELIHGAPEGKSTWSEVYKSGPDVNGN